jgi:3-methyl-2-oxobutanoate hydroxymethyltransferase
MERSPIVMVTAYDATFAAICVAAGADWLLVGDSLGMVVQGEKSTRKVTMQQMAYHTAMVRTGAPESFIIADLPFRSYESPDRSVENSRILMEAGANAVKFEGYIPSVADALSNAEIPFMGHLGLLPQTAEQFTVQGKKSAEAQKILDDAQLLQEKGAFSIVLECVPESLAESITRSLSIPTIGIGAGTFCSGQVLVLHDLLGLTEGYLPKFVKAFANLRQAAIEAVSTYGREVRDGTFPDREHTYH